MLSTVLRVPLYIYSLRYLGFKIKRWDPYTEGVISNPHLHYGGLARYNKDPGMIGTSGL